MVAYSQVHRNRDIHDVHVLGEPVQDPAKGSGVEEGHLGVEDAFEHAGVQLGRGQQGAHHHAGHGGHDENRLEHPQDSVNSQILVPDSVVDRGQRIR